MTSITTQNKVISVNADTKELTISTVNKNITVREGDEVLLSVMKDDALIGQTSKVNFTGDAKVTKSGDAVNIEISSTQTPFAPTLALHFAGIYETLQNLTDAIPSPTENIQAIVISPSEKYYHGVGGSWVELAPVGSFHPTYLGAYDTVQDLETAEPSAPDSSFAIVGAVSARQFYIKESGSWTAIKGTDLPALTGRVSTLEGRMGVAEGHLQSLQAADQVLQSNINQKISGIHVEDEDNNAFDEITGLYFEGATLEDQSGGDVKVKISPKITVANGQEPDSTALTGNALVFDGATISSAPGDANVIRVDMPSAGGSGIEIDNGVANLAGVKKVNFPTSEILAKSPTEVDIVPYIKASYQGREALVEDLEIQPPLKIEAQQGEQYKYNLYVDPSAYESQHSQSCLLRRSADLYVRGGVATPVLCDAEIVPLGEHFSIDHVKQGINVQDNTGGDTAATGGQLTELLASIGFFDNAPEDGNVKAWFEYHDPASPLAPEILVGVDGDPILYERIYKAGESLSPIILSGAMRATGQAPVILKVETSFSPTEEIVINPDKTMVCINQFSDGYETSVARIEFQRRAMVNIIPVIHDFKLPLGRITGALEGITRTDTVIGANEGMDATDAFGVINMTDVIASINNGQLRIRDNGTIADFYIDFQLDSDRTHMLRGREVKAEVGMLNPDNAFRLAMYAWTGEGDKQPNLYNSRNNGVPIIDQKWVLVNSAFFAENVSGSEQNSVVLGTVPANANNIAFFIYPDSEQSPSDITLMQFDVESLDKFTGYIEKELVHLNQVHLELDTSYAEFAASQGRYTINNNPGGNPMPTGKLLKGKANIELDHTINPIVGSQLPQYDGAIKFNADGQVKLSKTYRVCNETSADSTVTFSDYLFNADGSKSVIAESEETFTVPANTKPPGIVRTIPAYTIVVEAGQAIGGNAVSNKVDGAYLETTSGADFFVQTIVEFDEAKTRAYEDSPDLISAPIPKASIVDRRVYSFTGNTLQNIVIDVDIPADVHLSEIEVIKESGTTKTSVKDCEFAYDSSTKKLTVHVGTGVTQGNIYLTFWSGVA